MTTAIEIRPADADDWDEIWPIVEAVLAAGDTYVWHDLTSDEAKAVWLDAPERVFIAMDDEEVVGTYYLKPNQPGRGDHVANAAFMVAPAARGRGVGRAMAEHAIEEARAAGYRGMQFNMVVASNDSAVALWHDLGFDTVGRVPQAFRHETRGYVDALVMYRPLEE